MAGPVLVTGANGFIGTYLTEVLEGAGSEVVRTAAEAEAGAIGFELGDTDTMTDVLRRVRPTRLVHLAGISSPAHGEPAEIYEVNLIGTLNLLRSIERAGVKLTHLLALSSANVYGEAANARTDEECATAPANDYGVSKLGMEMVLRQRRNTVPITVVRLFNCTGVGQGEDFVIPKIVGHFARRESTLKLGNIYPRREYNDVRSVARILAALLEDPQPFNVVNVCSGRGYSLQFAIETLSGLSGHHIEVQADPRLVRANEIPELVGDPARLQRRLGAVEFTPLDETLRWMLEAST